MAVKTLVPPYPALPRNAMERLIKIISVLSHFPFFHSFSIFSIIIFILDLYNYTPMSYSWDFAGERGTDKKVKPKKYLPLPSTKPQAQKSQNPWYRPTPFPSLDHWFWLRHKNVVFPSNSDDSPLKGTSPIDNLGLIHTVDGQNRAPLLKP